MKKLLLKRVLVGAGFGLGTVGVSRLILAVRAVDWHKPVGNVVNKSDPAALPPVRTPDVTQPKPMLTSERARPSRTWKNSSGVTSVRIEPGEFTMGATEYAWEGPPHRVAITRPYSLGVFEITQGQYQVVMGTDPGLYKGSGGLPVEQLSWLDATKFCNKLSEQEGRKSAIGSTERKWWSSSGMATVC